MIEWIKHSDKIAVIDNEISYTYTELIRAAMALKNIKKNASGVHVCTSANPFEQLLSVIRGLVDRFPVYLGVEDSAETISKEDISADVFLVATTSGTTGRKKYIFKKHKQWLESFQAYSEIFNISTQDILFLNGSLEYTANLYSALHILQIGGTLVLSLDKNPKKWIELIEKHSCSIAYLVPSKLRLITKATQTIWYYTLEITTAGEALSQKVLHDFYKQCPNIKIHHYYGAAELGHISGIIHEELLVRPKSVGKAFKGVSIEIRDGIIFGTSLYSLSGGQTYDSAYDYGVLDNEGYLYLRGRRDTQINSHGRKFDAMMIIEALKCIDGIDDILFIDCVMLKDNTLASYGLYIISDSTRSVKITKDAVEIYLTTHIPRWQWPKRIKVVSNGIYSDTGKYDMVRIRALFE